jgi:hypothetical protein
VKEEGLFFHIAGKSFLRGVPKYEKKIETYPGTKQIHDT